jgi:OOP family OmpA-OmpF porin
MLESLNQTLEHSLSWRALQWRVTALRTGKSFAEVVLLNTLVYRVEQVFLIHRDSGLLLQHVKSGAVSIRDADMVSGMLTAIRDFVRDSFRVSEDEALENLQIGELSVWIEQGPHAVLAAVIRGTAPPELRQTMQEAIEQVHARVGEALADFSGNTEPFDVVRPTLEACLEARYRTPRKKVSPALWIAAAVVVLGIGVWAFFAVSSRSRWNGYLGALRAEPGIVVVSADRRDGRYVVTGLRDPLARDPASLLAASNLSPDDVIGSWQLYQALEPPIVLARGRQLLRPPDSVKLALADGVLTAGGSAPIEWIRESMRLAPLVPGVVRLDAAQLVESQVREIGHALAASPLLFVRGSTAFEGSGDRLLEAHLDRLRQLDGLAALANSDYTIEVVGHADSDGSPDTNESLSLSRAALVRSVIESVRPSRLRVVASGAGSRQPVTLAVTEADKRANRRVSLRIVPGVH